ncbi:hypothetical protein ABKN59_007417 [Abortiporus biennis]
MSTSASLGEYFEKLSGNHDVSFRNGIQLFARRPRASFVLRTQGFKGTHCISSYAEFPLSECHAATKDTIFLTLGCVTFSTRVQSLGVAHLSPFF